MSKKGFLTTYASTEYVLSREACKTDKVPLFTEALSKTNPEDLEDLNNQSLRATIRSNVASFLKLLFSRGISVKSLMPNDAAGCGTLPSLEKLELLLANGWDINNRDTSDRTLARSCGVSFTRLT
jgi:hypothetical protein